MRKYLFVVLASSLASGPATAAVIFSDTQFNDASTRNAESSPLSHITVSQSITINQIAVSVDLNQAGNIRFVAFDGTTRLLATPAKAFADDGQTFKTSDLFTPLTLLPGRDYYIGGIADVGGSWAFLFPPNPVTQNGITNLGLNGNVSGFSNPLPGGSGQAQIPIQLFSTPAAIPEPATLAAFGALAAFGFGYARRRPKVTPVA